MTRSLLFAAALALTACSHSGSVGGTTPDTVEQVPELPLASLVDPSAVGALHLDLSRIQSSSVYATATEWIDLLSEEQRASNDVRFVLQMIHANDSILFLDSPADGEPSAVLLLRGRFTDDDLARVARQDDQQSPRMGTYAGFTIRSVGSDGAVGKIGSHTMVLGRRRAVEQVLDRQVAGGSGSYPRDAAFVALSNRVDFASMPIAFAVVPTQAMRDSGHVESEPFLAALAGSNGVAFGFDLSDGLRGRVVADLGSSIEAMGLVTLARMQLGRIAEDSAVAETGLGVLLPLVQLDRDGSTVIADLTAPGETMSRVMQTLDGFVRRQAAAH